MIGAAILKDVQLLLRDRGRLLSLFALPVVFMVVFGSMFKFGPDRGKPRSIPVWNGRPELHLASLGDGFAIEPAASPDAVRHAVAPGDRVAGLVIPPTGPVELVIDLAGPVQVRAPVQRWKALLGTLVPYFVIGCVQLAFLFGLGALGFGMQIAGSLLGLVVLSLAVVLCATCLGLLVASVGGN